MLLQSEKPHFLRATGLHFAKFPFLQVTQICNKLSDFISKTKESVLEAAQRATIGIHICMQKGQQLVANSLAKEHQPEWQTIDRPSTDPIVEK